MAERGILHHSSLPAFQAWLDKQGITHRPGKGTFEVMQIEWPKHRHHALCRRVRSEHVSVPMSLYPLVQRFLNDRSEP